MRKDVMNKKQRQVNGQEITKCVSACPRGMLQSNAHKAMLAIMIMLLPALARAQSTYDVTLYGAQGDNFTDDTQAVQSAIDAAQSAGAGTVYFPSSAGCYMVTGLTFYSNITYNGADQSVCIKSISSDAPLVRTLPTSAFSNVTISNLTFDGNATAYTGNDCLELRGPTNVLIDRVTTTRCGEDGVYVTGWGTGPGPAGQGDGLLITNLTSNYNGRSGMSIITGRNITVRDSVFEHHNISRPFAGVDVETGTASQSAENITFENCTFRDNAYHGFNVWESHANRPNLNLRLINSTFQSNGRDGAYIAASGYILSGIYVSGSMAYNRGLGGYRGGLDIWNAANVVVTNLSVTGASQAVFLWGVNGANVVNSSLSGSSLDLNTNRSMNVAVYDSTQLAHGTASGSYATLSGTAPKITTQALPGATASVTYAEPLIATGDAAITWTLAGGNLPPGLSLLDVGTISGTPVSGGVYTFTVDSTNGITYDEKTFSLTVAAAPLAITTGSLPNGTVNSIYSAVLSAIGGTPPYVWSAGGLPSGLNLNTATGQISGTPATAGLALVSVQVTDASFTTVNKTLTLSIAAPLVISTASLPDGTVNSSYSATLSATGGTLPYLWSAAGLPPGLSLNVATGQISGTPATAGSVSVSVQVTDALSMVASKTLSLSIAAPLVISTASLPDGTVNSSYSATLSAAGGRPPYAWSASGLPAGLSLNSAIGQISGTPTTAGSASTTVQLKDSTGAIATQTFTISIAAISVPLVISTTSLPNGTVNSSYAASLSATGGTPPYGWNASGLPAGLSLNSATGQITGTPAAAGSMTVAVTVMDAVSAIATKNLTVSIAPSLGPIFDVMSYGARGDGSTNDTTAIQNAINAASSAGGGTVYFPTATGCYRVTSLTFRSGLTYAGQTSSVCIKSLNAGMGADLIKTSTGSAFSNATISNLVLDGNTTSPTSRYDCLSLVSPTNVSINNVTAQYCDEDGFYITGYGTNLAIPGDGLLMTGVLADHNGRNGMSIITGKNITVRNSVFQNSNGTAPYDGVDIEPNNSSQTVQNVTFENSSFLNNGKLGSSASGHHGFNVWEAFGSLPNLNLRLIDCTFSGNLRDGLYAAASGATLSGIYVLGGSMSNNQALNGYRGGVDIWNTSNVVISNLSVTSPSQAVFLWGVSGATITNSTLSGASTDLNTNSSTGVQVYSSTNLVHGTHSGSYTTPSGSGPAITTASLPAGALGSGYSQSLAAAGTPTITWTTVAATGNGLPPGITLSPDGLLSGTPTGAGTFAFTVQATNGVALDEKTFTLTVN